MNRQLLSRPCKCKFQSKQKKAFCDLKFQNFKVKFYPRILHLQKSILWRNLFVLFANLASVDLGKDTFSGIRRSCLARLTYLY